MRTIDRMLSALLGLVLFIVGLAVAIGMAGIASGRKPAFVPVDRWYGWLRTVRLDDSRFLQIAVVTSLIGLLLIILELRPRPPEQVDTSTSAGTPLRISRQSVESRIDSAAARAGVDRAHSRVRGKPGRWRLQLRGVAWPDRRDTVTATVRAELDLLYAPPDVPVSLVLRRPPGRVR